MARPSPARAEPHDETSWLPLSDLEDLPPIEDLRTGTDEGAETRDIPVGLPSPARAEPHDETSWLPLPEVEDLPEITELVDPDTATAAVPPAGGPVRRARFAVPPRRALAAALVAVSLVVGVYAVPKLFGSGGDHVQLQVDGRQVDAQSSASTVGAFLASENIKLGPADQVVPKVSTALSDGLTVRIVRAFPVNVTIDGTAKVMYTADSQPKDFVASLKLPSTVAVLSGPTKLRAGAHLELNTRRVGTLAVDGQAVNFNLPVLTVQELLDNYKVKLGPQDFTTPSVSSIIPVDNAFVTVTRVAIATTSQLVPYSLPLVTANDPNTPVGQTHDSAGTPGWMKITYEITNNNGSAVGQVPISQVPVVPAVAPVHWIGSKADPRWQEIANCETGGNWSMVGSTYSGGLGIYNGTWNAFGGQQFASNPGLATREQQIIVAERIRARYGFGAWGCGRKLGLG
ncbi:MAG TPA: transglycosylase family protein [Acidimicrobiia bacterium]|nr:transglycosylase family protein [Acidimicrobiia bacterium]